MSGNDLIRIFHSFFDSLRNADWPMLADIETFWAQLRRQGVLRGECGTCKLNCRCWVRAVANKPSVAHCVRHFSAGQLVDNQCSTPLGPGASNEAALHAARQQRYDVTLLNSQFAAPNILVSEVCKLHKIRPLNEYKRVS